MESDRSRFAAIIPAYQEEKHIADVARRTRAELPHVLVVDDGSTDRTAENARVKGVEVVVHEVNRGKGEAIKTGLRHWFERDAEYMLLLDGDGQHLPEEIDRFLQAAVASKATLFVGTRMRNTTSMPLIRRLVNGYMSRKISRACGQAIPDTQCGFRMLHRSVVPAVLGGANHFDYETEMLIIASRGGHRIAAVPITTVYSDEISSISPVRDTIRFFRLMRRYRTER